jgi:hypothetical protein
MKIATSGGTCFSDSSESPSKLFFFPAFDFRKNTTTATGKTQLVFHKDT